MVLGSIESSVGHHLSSAGFHKYLLLPELVLAKASLPFGLSVGN